MKLKVDCAGGGTQTEPVGAQELANLQALQTAEQLEETQRQAAGSAKRAPLHAFMTNPTPTNAELAVVLRAIIAHLQLDQA